MKGGKSNFIMLCLVLILFSCKQNADIEIINVADFGILPNTNESITGAINELIQNLENDSVTIVFPKGRYDFRPDSSFMRNYYETNTYDVNPKKLAILIDNKKNITIDANGSEFVYHGHIQPFTLDNSENITIKNITIDWDHPLTAESEILEADSAHILIHIDTTQFPYSVHEKGIKFAADDWVAEWKLTSGSNLIEINDSHIIPAFTGDHGTVNGDLKNVVYSAFSPGKVLMEGKFTKTPQVGNFWVMRHSTRDHAGMFIFHSKNIKLENINVYHTSGLGVLSQYSENLEMQKVNMIPNPNKNRYLAGHDDGLHFMGCSGEIIINDCDAQGLMDDPINIHGTFVPVVERMNDRTIKCNYAHKMSMGLLWASGGNVIGFVDKKTMNTKGKGTVKSFIQENEEGFTLEFVEDLPDFISDQYSLENLSYTPNVTITNCFAGSNRARGYLISTAGKVRIENNIFETSGSAILIAGDANYWYESGAVKDLIIRNNEFRSPCNSSLYQFCNAIISIYPEIPNADPKSPFHQNIVIENNSFNPADYPILYARSVDGLRFNNNTITRSHDYEPWHFQKQSFFIDACLNVEIMGNKFEENVLGKNIMLKNMSEDQLNFDRDVLTLEKYIGEVIE